MFFYSGQRIKKRFETVKADLGSLYKAYLVRFFIFFSDVSNQLLKRFKVISLKNNCPSLCRSNYFNSMDIMPPPILIFRPIWPGLMAFVVSKGNRFKDKAEDFKEKLKNLV